MKTFVLPAIAAAFSAVTLHAAPLDDVAVAAQRLADAPNYTWTSAETTARGPMPNGQTMETSKTLAGQTEKDGFTVTKSTMKAGNTLVEDTIYWGTQIAYLRNGSWKTAEELQAAMGVPRGGGESITVTGTGVGGSGRGIGTMTIASQNNLPPGAGRPAQMALSLLAQVKSVTASGDAFVAEMSQDYIARAMRGSGRNGPLVVSQGATASTKFWLKDGVLAKYQIKIKVAYENGDAPPSERTITAEIKNVGTTVVDVPAEAKAKFKL